MKIGVPWQFLDQLAAEPKEVFNASHWKSRKVSGAQIVDSRP